MKALSLRQPWAWMVVHGGKNVENRVWSTLHRGPFLVHTGAAKDLRYHRDAVDFARKVMGEEYASRIPCCDALQYGGIIGRVSIVDVLKPCLLESDVDEDVWCRCDHPWHMGGQFGFTLKDAEPLPFRPMRGLQRWWDVPTDSSPAPRIEQSKEKA